LYKNNDENDIFYIGSTVNPKTRILGHTVDIPYNVYNCRIEMSILEEVEIDTRRELFKLEWYWIQQFVAWGFKLTNYNLHYSVNVRLLKMNTELDKEIDLAGGLSNFINI